MGDARLRRPRKASSPRTTRSSSTGDREELSIVTHLGRPDDRIHELPDHELLVIVQGPHGYISSSWYGEHVEVPTWNFLTAHLAGTPEILSDEENSAVLHRLVEYFERRADRPRLLDGTPQDAENARKDMRGTVGLRLTPDPHRRQAQDEPEPVNPRSSTPSSRNSAPSRARRAAMATPHDRQARVVDRSAMKSQSREMPGRSRRRAGDPVERV